MRIYLLGYMASGKSKLGKEISDLTGFSFWDLDEVFEERYRIGIVDFFEKYGEEAFRQIERQLLAETEKLENTIIATGGGTPCSEENIEFIKSQGISIYIRMNTKELFSRLKNVKKKRPMIKDVPMSSLENFIAEQLRERDPFYQQANYIIDGPFPDQDKLVGLISEIKGREESSS
ncbi:MAG: shikimate kinase [Bacteroidales bacterium]|jgi:shikimate kinase